MRYEPSYSKTQTRIIGQRPEWLSLVDFGKRVDSILDLGAGDGRNSVFLRELYPNTDLIALDVSLIRCARCRQATDATIVCGNGMDLPFGTQCFDLVVSAQVIEHVPDDRTFIREIKRVLKPGGLALLSSVIKMRFGWYFYRNRKGDWVLDPTHVREYNSVQEFTNLFQDRFRILSVTTHRFRFSPVRFVYRLFIKLGIVCNPTPHLIPATKLGALLERWEVPIPRYRCVTVVAENTKSDASTPRV